MRDIYSQISSQYIGSQDRNIGVFLYSCASGQPLLPGPSPHFVTPPHTHSIYGRFYYIPAYPRSDLSFFPTVYSTRTPFSYTETEASYSRVHLHKRFLRLVDLLSLQDHLDARYTILHFGSHIFKSHGYETRTIT
jgi:hypothetical protein